MRAGQPDMSKYNSCYLRTVHPTEPTGLWIRHTYHQAASGAVRGARWITLFTPHGVEARKTSFPGRPSADSDRFAGEAGDARWDIKVRSLAEAFEHLPARWMYKAPLPKTKPVSVYPLAAMDGTCAIGGRGLELAEWRGMVGHNWGSEHAHRWIWIHVAGFDGRPDAWLDITLARLKIGGLVTPWIPNGALCLDGQRHRLGGLLRRAQVREQVERADVSLAGRDIAVSLEVRAPTREAVVVWQYGDARGSKHHVSNCSIARARVRVKGDGGTRELESAHGAAYELGMDAPPAGYEVQPYPDPQP